ncbi:NAD(P)H-binding protein [Allokutzneria sp. A3M-2-11 16]|uniref:SDR family oxidoreductase n=1 Tax=Allokutzneria sp. A3M-2-11 16 TaxID=2962043 RepID=UPI0020B7F132|nr:NAD(P)H-binding protein [Allokutzneria sp. A3M-2-11 16]MCP3804017.1 NAD(P)H-binding protein [Allokutzneria sp. A3M-2-11 16]
MNTSILVTGGTGTLGRAVVAHLRETGHRPRVMSRRPGPGHVVADLVTGSGVDAALDGVDTVINCATTLRGKRDVTATKTLVDAVRRAGCRHLVHVSIVGVDRIRFGYYNGKLASEEVVRAVPHTILRATQFHDLLRRVFSGLAKLPLVLVPDLRFQPVDVRDVAARLVELALGDPIGRAPDFGGPEVREAADLARSYLAGRRRRIVPIRLPGKAFRAYRAGFNLTPEHADGRITFEEYL